MDPQLRAVVEQAMTAHRAGHLALAEGLYRQVLRREPQSAGVLHLLGLCLYNAGRHADAIAQIEHAITVGGAVPEFLYNLGTIARDAGDWARSEQALTQAIRLRPQFVEAIDNLCGVLTELGRHDEALALAQHSLTLRDGRQAYGNLARIAHDQGRIDDSLAALRKALEFEPYNAMLHSSLIYTLYLSPSAAPDEIFREHQEWVRRQAALVKTPPAPFTNDRNPERRLRVGYLSPDFRDHPVGQFLEPVLSHRDREHFEVFGYCDCRKPDHVTRRLRDACEHWRDVPGVGDDKTAALIRQDRIDVLVDLSNHTSGSRLPVFLRRPAPVQISYLGQTSTTGLPSVDYLITAEGIHPSDLHPNYCTEQLLRIPGSFSAYVPPPNAPEVNPLPASSNGAVTFLSTNNPAKINDQVLGLWSRILRSIPNSRLILRVPRGANSAWMTRRLAAHQIPPERCALTPIAPRDQFLQIYHHADVFLDPFPYNGYTTTHESLYMGLPVITLAANPLGPSRYGRHLLSTVGLPELITTTPEQYLRLAVELAGDLPRLSKWRGELRNRLQQSPLMNAPYVAAQLESAYRSAWRTWCGGGSR